MRSDRAADSILMNTVVRSQVTAPAETLDSFATGNVLVLLRQLNNDGGPIPRAQDLTPPHSTTKASNQL